MTTDLPSDDLAAPPVLQLDECALKSAKGNPPFTAPATGARDSFPAYSHVWHTPFDSFGDRQDFYSLQRDGVDVARACTKPPIDSAGSSYGCGKLTGDIREVYLIETDPAYAQQGTATKLIHLIAGTAPAATWIAYSHEDKFWDKTGWHRYPHPVAGYSALYVLEPRSPAEDTV